MAAAAAALCVLGFLAFWSLTPPTLASADAAVYAEQIEHGDFTSRPVHLGYYAIGAGWRRLVPVFDDHALNLLSGVAAALTLGLVFLLGRALTGDGPAAACGALALAVHHPFVDNATNAEVYMLQTLFLVLAAALWLRGRALGSGLAFAASALVTPASLLAAPGFALVRPRWRPLVRFGLVVALVLGAVLAPLAGDYLFGGRGLLRSAAEPFALMPALAKEAYETVVGYFAFLPFVAIGAWRLARTPALRRYGLALVALWAAFLFAGEKFGDVPVQLPTYVLLAPVGALGVATLLRAAESAGAPLARFRWALLPAATAMLPAGLVAAARPQARPLQALPAALPALVVLALALALLGALAAARSARRRLPVALVAGACLAVNGWLNVLLVQDHNRRTVEYRELVLASAAAARPDALAIGEWSRGILFNHHLGRPSYDQAWIDPEWLTGGWGPEREREAAARWRSALRDGREVWLLEPHPELASELSARGYALEPFGELVRAEPPAPGDRPAAPTPSAPPAGTRPRSDR